MFEVLAVLFVILQVGVLASLAVMAFSVNNRLEDIHLQMVRDAEAMAQGREALKKNVDAFGKNLMKRHMPDPKEV